MSLKKIILSWVFVVFAVALTEVTAARAQQFQGDRSGELIAFSVLRDAPRHAAIEDICCGNMEFGAAVTSVRSHYGNAPIWLKLDGTGPFDLLEIGTVVDEVIAYYKNSAGGEWIAVRTGDLVAISERSNPGPHMVLPLTGKLPGSAVYIRVDQPALVTIDLTGWSISSFSAMDRTDHLFKVFLTGIICATIAYNGFVGALVRSPVFLLNAVTICALLLLALYLSGYGVAYVWVSRPGWSNHLLLAAVYVGVLFGGAFMWEFLRDQEETFWDGWQLLLPGLVATPAMLATLVLPYWLVQPVLLLLAFGLLATAFAMVTVRAWKGSRQARILLFPLSFAVIPGTAFVYLEKLLGVRTGLIDNNLLEVTLSLESILFSLAIASRFRMGELENREINLKLMRLRAEGAAKTIAAQDAERQRLAKELHDGVGQDFLVVLGNLKRLGNQSDTANWKAEAPSLIETTTTALNELRRISKEMHPASISHLGLKKALDTLFEHLETSSQVETFVTFEFDESKLDMNAKLQVYRIFQECLSNIARHSGASCCKASIGEKNKQLCLRVDDDGTGLELGAGPGSSGLGFVSIDERVRSLGGDWKMSQSKMGGVRLEVWFPLVENGRVPRQ